MDTLEAIRTRRSIRRYTKESVAHALIEVLLDAAMQAPSAGNQQPWHFVILRDRHLLERIPTFHPHADMAKSAPVSILICGEPALERYRGRWMLDCSAAAQNLLLAAHARGLGAVWVGLYPEEARMRGMRELLDLPEEIMPLALIPIGHPAELKPPSRRYREDRVHYDRW